MTDRENQLFNENMKLVPWVLLNKLGIPPTDSFFDDLKQEGYIALMNACSSYDESKSEKFSTFATSAIYYHCLNWRLDNAYCLRRRPLSILISYQKEAPQTYDEICDFCKRNHVSIHTLSSIIAMSNVHELDRALNLDCDNNDMDAHAAIADPSTMDGLTIPEESQDISMKEIEELWFKVAGELNEKQRAIWIDYCYAMKFKAETEERHVPEIACQNLATKYGVSRAYASKIIVRGRKALRVLIDEKMSR